MRTLWRDASGQTLRASALKGEGGDGHEPSRPEVHFQSHSDLRNVCLLRRVWSCGSRPAGRKWLARWRLTRQRWVPRWKLAWRRWISRRQRPQWRTLRRLGRFCAFRRRQQRFHGGNVVQQRPRFRLSWFYSAYEFHRQFVRCAPCRGTARPGRCSHDSHKRASGVRECERADRCTSIRGRELSVGGAAAADATACRHTASASRSCASSHNGARTAACSPGSNSVAVSDPTDVNTVAADANSGLFSHTWPNAPSAARCDPSFTDADANFPADIAGNVTSHSVPSTTNAWRTIRRASAPSAGPRDACVQTNRGGSAAANEPSAACTAALCRHGR